MTAEVIATAGATSHSVTDWHAINWHNIEQQVRRLQARIVKAEQAGKPGKVKALQRLLTHSFSGRALAVRRVTENQGKNTPGVDREVWNTPAKKAAAIHRLKPRGYRPQPLRRVYIKKSNGKLRPLDIPCILCRTFQALYLLGLDPVAEARADPHSYGFRRGRSCADAIEQCFGVLAQWYSAQWILEADIRSCFNSISHRWLQANIPMDKAMLTKWLKAGYVYQRKLYPTEEGSPQGSIISPVLANLTLDGLERELREKFPKAPPKQYQPRVNLIRYADDFCITGDTKELLELEVKPLVERFLTERGLALSEEKTKITHIEVGFDFLAKNVRKYKGKLLIKPAKKSVKAHLDTIRNAIKENKQLSAGKLIAKLNPIIRGWTNYHRHKVSKDTFGKVDHQIFKALWRWAKRRHPNKGNRWIKDKYFLTVGNRNWVFSGKLVDKKGLAHTIQLLNEASVPIVRHTRIHGKANPYDPQWETYFERRLDLKTEHDLKAKRKLLYLWKEQNGLCPICREKITKLTGWHSHHIVWKVYGGGDGLENRVLLHPNCHRQVHNRPDLTVEKPRPPNKGVKEAQAG